MHREYMLKLCEQQSDKLNQNNIMYNVRAPIDSQYVVAKKQIRMSIRPKPEEDEVRIINPKKLKIISLICTWIVNWHSLLER